MLRQWNEEEVTQVLVGRYADVKDRKICALNILPSGIAVLLYVLDTYHPRVYVDHYTDGSKLVEGRDLRCAHIGTPSKQIDKAMAEYMSLVANEKEKSKARY